MSSSRSSRRGAIIAIQSLLGAVFLGLWALLAVIVFDDELIRVIVSSVPYFACYEIGVFSRYVPGLRTFAKRLE